MPYLIKSWMGENTLMIGTDYRHADSSTELSALSTLKETGGISAEMHRKIVEDNRGSFTACRKAECLLGIDDTAQLEENLNNKPHAPKLYREIVEEYPDSPYANQAKTRLAELEKTRQILIKDCRTALALTVGSRIVLL